MGNITGFRRVIFRSKLLAPIKFTFFYFTKRQEASRQAETVVGKENVTNRMITDMIWDMSRYHFLFWEYFLHHLEYANKKRKESIIPECELMSWSMSFNDPANSHIFKKKQDTYEYYKKYFKRELVYLASASEECKATFRDFTQRHKRFIVKPEDAFGGRGVKIMDIDNDSVDDAFGALFEGTKKGVVIEELIHQCDAMAHFNASSVNTVRMITVRLDDRVEVLPPSFRVGYTGSVVDNGCINCGVDLETGIIKRVIDKHTGKEIVLHPDSGVALLGEQIPGWEDIIPFAKELATVVPSNRYTGWDLAHTDDGWVLVEANFDSELMNQYSHGVGCRKELTAWLKELNRRPFA